MSGDLDEYRIREIVAAGAPVDAFGVGTQLATSADAPNMSATYKLAEIDIHGIKRFTAKYSANQLKPRFTTPDVLFATKASGSSNRPVETITPLSAALNLPYDASCSDDEYATLATEIKSNSDYTDKIVLICWHHGNIPALAEQFGITQPPTWDATVFDRVWEIAYNPGPPNLQDLPQQLLYGDSKS